MKTRMLLAFAAILTVTVVAGAWRDAPVAPSSEGAGLSAHADRDVALTPLEVSVECIPPNFGYIWASCTATASGGTGTGYTFVWYWRTIGAVDWFSSGAHSYASADCSYDPLYAYAVLSVWVGDSAGGSASGGASPCDSW